MVSLTHTTWRCKYKPELTLIGQAEKINIISVARDGRYRPERAGSQVKSKNMVSFFSAELPVHSWCVACILNGGVNINLTLGGQAANISIISGAGTDGPQAQKAAAESQEYSMGTDAELPRDSM